MITKIPFGRTGHMSTRTIFGAVAVGRVNQSEANKTLETLLEYGVNHIDTAASYGDSELRVGHWMDQHRNFFFLATKTGERTYQKARDEFHRSLERLRVNQVDLLQLHNLTDPQEWEIAMGPGGALEMAIEARQQGLLRFIGVTGHGTQAPVMHKRSLERFDFDSVLLPYNFTMMQNPEYAANFNELAQMCKQRNVAVQTIKAVARGPWGEKPRTHEPWYEPLDKQENIDKAVDWVLARPDIFLNTAGDVTILPMILNAASRFNSDKVPSDQEMEQLTQNLDMAPLFV